ncbi:MAG: hypothetical protein JWS12_491 [Candidatus Saccharibacteria bacterium]|nr:hypothetical protein [Candidatus Saccharibacteria bacterium]
MDETFRSNTVTANGLDSAFSKLVAEVAKAELTSASALAFEGLTRILEDRFNDPAFLEIVAANPENYPQVAQELETRGTPADH